MKRVGLSRPKQPLHPNRADAIAPGRPSPAVQCVSTSSFTTAPLWVSTPVAKRHRSRSPSASPSPLLRASPTALVISTNTIRSEQQAFESSPTWHSLLLLSSSPLLPDLSTPRLPPSPLVIPLSRPFSVSPVNLPAAPHVPAPTAPPPVSGPDPPSPSQWTLAEIIENCTTWEEYVRYRPIGYARLRDSWAVLDERIRKRHYKQPRERQADVFTHVRSYTETHLQSSRVFALKDVHPPFQLEV